jgi:hypothetical protein
VLGGWRLLNLGSPSVNRVVTLHDVWSSVVAPALGDPFARAEKGRTPTDCAQRVRWQVGDHPLALGRTEDSLHLSVHFRSGGKGTHAGTVR